MNQVRAVRLMKESVDEDEDGVKDVRIDSMNGCKVVQTRRG